VGDHERERAVASLRRHYLAGRLSHVELEERVALALAARDRRQLVAATHELPAVWRDPDVAARAVAAARRGVRLAAIALAWLVFSCILLVALALTALVHGVHALDVALFLVLWVAATWTGVRRARRP